MAVTVIINNKSFVIPSPGEDPGWGEDTTGWIVEANKVINSIFSGGDIIETSTTIGNDQTTPQAVVGLLFNPATIRAAVVEYSVYRISDSTQSGQAESGRIEIVYDNNASPGSQWLLSQEAGGSSGVSFDITDAGQFTYVSSDIGAVGHSGLMKFKARTLSQ